MSHETSGRIPPGIALLQLRTKSLALGAIKACRTLQPSIEGRIIAGQLIRSAASVAANYRAVRRARSHKEFIAKIGVVIEESDETLFWLELAMELGAGATGDFKALAREADELTSIFVVTRLNARRRAETHRNGG
jgi:four helix bundle protein